MKTSSKNIYKNKILLNFFKQIFQQKFFKLIFLACLFFEYLNFFVVKASLQARRLSSLPTKPCDKPCFNGGICRDGLCVCPAGWTGSQCDSCFGRLKKNGSTKGYITDGPVNYSASARCIWIIENEVKGPLLLTLDDFFTECCWDHLYIYDGNGVYDNLIAAFSGTITSGTEVVAKSGQAIIYFISDLAFNLPGFNISYSHGKCLYNCSMHGKCMPDGNCKCDKSYKGEYCSQQICTDSMNGKTGPCQNRAVCQNGKCGCTKYSHGDNCQELILNPVWDSLLTFSNKLFPPKASHKAVLIDDSEIWLFGGIIFNTKKKANDLIYFNLNDQEFRQLNSSNTPPSSRYDHSMVVYNKRLYIFGGVINENRITNEFWSFDLATLKWTKISTHNESPFAMPLAVAGHSAHVIGNEMYVFFGYNPFEGFIYRLQIYSFETGNWTKGPVDLSIIGRFGHSSVVYQDASKNSLVLIYGGFTAPVPGYSYGISDELLLFDPNEHSWTSLGTTGLPLFRHSAVILEGIMLIVGGNSHNESSKSRINDCYSGQILAFDIVCREWLKISIKDSQLSSRYGHAAVADSKNMYIIGGFTGTMHNDILKFTPANCDNQAASAEECENAANGIRCVFVNKTCKKALPNISYMQPFLSFIKNDNPRLQADCSAAKRDRIYNTCLDIKECNECVFQKGCGWCESTQNCLGSDTSCADGLLTDSRRCPLDSSKKHKKPSKPRPCNLATNCFACRQLKHCSWFSIMDTKHVCVSLIDEAHLIEEHRVQLERLSPSSTAALSSSSNTNLMMNSIVQVPERTLSTEVINFPLDRQNNNNNNNSCPLPCSIHLDCHACVQSQCMWCPSTKRCVNMDTYMISFPYGQCQAWITSANTNHACQLDPYNCEVQKTCSECQTVGPRCGWCDDGSGTGLGRCLAGTDSGPLENGRCPTNRWFFTGEPSCQCNGHSTCTENTTLERRCRQCSDKTRGEHCDTCDVGYFGDPRNGGTCQECQCNNQAIQCNPETGDCHCSTKGVTGPHCDKCEPKYIGDPKNGRPCTYELIIDFIFTFKLDGDDAKDKYVNQINFFSIPFKRDTDVQFSITCEGDSGARVSINLTTNIIEGRPAHSKQLMASQLCTGTGIKRTYSATDPGFAFGTDSNTTFYVKVNEFTTPIKIQISFAQSPPINWVLFFVIFAACFIVLLVVAGLLWMIKLRVEWYRNIRRRHEEIEEMASRPFASVQLEVSANYVNTIPSPISIEPSGNYQFGIYTLVVRLPTGGRPYTPYGTSGLAVASSLCQLTHAQLALLQPPDPLNQQQNRKSNLRRFIPFMRS